MSKSTLAAEATAVTAASKAVLASAVTLTRRTAALALALSTMRGAAEAGDVPFRQYVTEATEAIREGGDWSRAGTEVREAVAVIAGTTGGLSSVMVAEAIGVSQSTASRAIRKAKAAE